MRAPNRREPKPAASTPRSSPAPAVACWIFNLLVVAHADGEAAAVLGFVMPARSSEQCVQQATPDDDDRQSMKSRGRDTVNVAAAAARLSQVVGALEAKAKP